MLYFCIRGAPDAKVHFQSQLSARGTLSGIGCPTLEFCIPFFVLLTSNFEVRNQSLRAIWSIASDTLERAIWSIATDTLENGTCGIVYVYEVLVHTKRDQFDCARCVVSRDPRKKHAPITNRESSLIPFSISFEKRSCEYYEENNLRDYCNLNLKECGVDLNSKYQSKKLMLS